MEEVGLIYMDQFDLRLLSYLYLALSNNDIFTISIAQEYPREKDSSSFIVGQHKRLIRC